MTNKDKMHCLEGSSSRQLPCSALLTVKLSKAAICFWVVELKAKILSEIR